LNVIEEKLVFDVGSGLTLLKDINTC